MPAVGCSVALFLFFITLPSDQIVPCRSCSRHHKLSQVGGLKATSQPTQQNIQTRGGTSQRVSGGPEKLTAHSFRSHQSMTCLVHAGCRMLSRTLFVLHHSAFRSNRPMPQLQPSPQTQSRRRTESDFSANAAKHPTLWRARGDQGSEELTGVCQIELAIKVV